jgi:plastocyanin
MSRRGLRGAAAAAALGLVMGISSVATGAAATVRMSDGPGTDQNYYRPQTVRVQKGTRVVWRNNGSRPHTTTSNGGLWDSGTLQPGQKYARKFRKVGTFRFHCEIHDGMTGKIVVKA